MAPSWRRLLKHPEGRNLVELCRRPKIHERIAGFLVGFSGRLILLHRLDWSTFRLDGYTILRQDDVKQWRIFSRASFWQVKAARKLNLRPRRAAFDLTDWKTGAEDIASRFPLVTIHREVRFAHECWIGAPTEITSKRFTLEILNPSAKWDGPYRMKISEITRIDFAGGYESALAFAAPKRRVSLVRRRGNGWLKSLRAMRGLNLQRVDEPVPSLRLQ